MKVPRRTHFIISVTLLIISICINIYQHQCINATDALTQVVDTINTGIGG